MRLVSTQFEHHVFLLWSLIDITVIYLAYNRHIIAILILHIWHIFGVQIL